MTIQGRAKQNCKSFKKHFTQIGPNVASAIPTSTVHAQDYLTRTNTPFDLNEARLSKVLKSFFKANVAKAIALLR